MGRNTRGGNRGYRPMPRDQLVSRRDDTLPTHFVPSFSVRRHVALEDEEVVMQMQRNVRGIVGKFYEVTNPSNLTLKAIEQRKFIERAREANAQPTSRQIHDLVLTLQEGLTELLSSAPRTLAVPIGKVARFGYSNQALALQIEGWRGYNARYEYRDRNAQLTPYGIIVGENQLCIGAIAAAMDEIAEDDYVVDGLARTPHLTIARNSNGIREHDLRMIEAEISDAVPPVIHMADPIIEMRLAPQKDPVVAHVRHSYRSLHAA